MRIIIVGFAACYKSTVGKLLADRLKYAFIDTDAEIERASGLTVQRIFEASGERYFRQKESELLLDLAECSDTVISCGGGSVLADSFEAFSRDSAVVWLTATAETVLSRLGTVPRPLFDGLTVEQLDVCVKDRAPLYDKYAQAVFATDGKTSEHVTEEIYNWLKQNY